MKDVRIYRFDASGCNGCDVEVFEVLALGLPLDKLKVAVVEYPEEANTLVVTGGANIKSRAELERVYKLINEPRVVIAVGACALTWGIFKGGYATVGPIDQIIPVNLYIYGCPPRAQVIAGALVEAFGLDIGQDQVLELLKIPEQFRAGPIVDPAKCIGCTACVASCPAAAIVSTDNGTEREIRFNHKDCIYCATCKEVCPTQAISLSSSDKPYKPWFGDKTASCSVTNVMMNQCSVCGSPDVPADQLVWELAKVSENINLSADIREGLLRSASMCPKCRRSSIDETREGRKILAMISLNSLKAGE
jgi:Ni,Fe-hydrogenase III small subunit/ferredoxin